MTDKEEIIPEIVERLRFLQELGIEALEVDLATDSRSPGHELDHASFETYVPTDEEVPVKLDEAPPLVSPAAPAPRKSDLLRRFRLAERAAPDTEGPPSQEVGEAQAKNPEPIPAEGPSALFEDLQSGLPESDETLDNIRNDIGKECSRCRLCENRTQVVNSVGKPSAELMFIGEAPGADEDLQGEPFVGRAGQLLTKIIEAIDLKREDVFIGNINRCRPPENRRPLPDEAKICKPFLLREIAVVRPKVIVVLGNTACQNLLDTKVGITRLRGKFLDYFGVKVMPTFHPAYLLRDPRKKREVWDDMKLVRDALAESDSRE